MQILSVAAAFLFLGNAALCSGFGRVKSGVVIDGIEVGGLPYAAAEKILREDLATRVLPVVIHAPKGDLFFDLPVADDAAELVRRAKRDEKLTLSFTRRWADMEGTLQEVCARNSETAIPAELGFSRAGFTYSPGKSGIACDYGALLEDAQEGLSRERCELSLKTRSYLPAVTEEMLRKRTRKLASFSTAFDPQNAPRSRNIALAAEKISGSVILPGEEFSFNKTVGARTAENGFEIANVIYEGEFVPGVGGGVCQTSTTLFGAALRAGLTITESHAHSLSVGYVPPSLDAMVSSSSDLRFLNPYAFPVYLLGGAEGGSVTFSVYGMPDGRTYRTESVTLARISPPEPEIVEGESGELRREKEGIKSESYLIVTDKGGRLLSRTRIRRDCYAAVRGKRGALPVPKAGESVPKEGQESLVGSENIQNSFEKIPEAGKND